MKYFIFNLFCRSVVFIIFSCTFDRRTSFVKSDDKSIKELLNESKFSEWPKLYRIRESANYFFSKVQTSEQINNRLNDDSIDEEKSTESRKWVATRYKEKKNIVISSRVPLVWNAAEFGVNKPKPWLKSDPESVEHNAKAEEAVSSRKMNARKLSIKIGDMTIESEPNHLSTPDCGLVVTMVIVNGKEAAKGAYPWIALVQKQGQPFCAGTIINKEWVVSAAHCFMSDSRPELFTIRVGTNNRNEGTIYKVSKVIVHERFNLDNMFNSDISLLKIDGPIKINRLVRPACLPSQSYMEPKSNNLMVVGWGVTKWGDRHMPIYLQEVKLSIIDIDDCSKKYSVKKYNIYRSQVCTWNDKEDACQGDSGGPAIEYVDGRGTLVGIVSYGATCADQFPGIFTKVSYFINWISTHISNN